MSAVELFFKKIVEVLRANTQWEDLSSHEQIIFTHAINAILALAEKGSQNA